MAARLCRDTLLACLDDDWEHPAANVDWTCRQTLERHPFHGRRLRPSLAARATSPRGPTQPLALAQASTAQLIGTMHDSFLVLGRVGRAAPPTARSYHTAGMVDAEGWAIARASPGRLGCGLVDLLPPEQARVREALAAADAEYRRRNGQPIPIQRLPFDPFWIVQANEGQSVDAYAYDEAKALMEAALAARKPAAAPSPPAVTPWPPSAAGSGPSPFSSVPSAAQARDRAASLPWWRRVFPDATAPPATVRVLPASAFDPYLRQMRDEHRFETEPVYQRPVQTIADLVELEDSVADAPPAPLAGGAVAGHRTVSGGGGGFGGYFPVGLGQLMGGYMAEIVRSGAHDLTPQQYLDIAIQQRNYLVHEGGSKTLIAHWNREIRDLLGQIRRMPV